LTINIDYYFIQKKKKKKKKVYILPDGYEVNDSSLDDIKVIVQYII